MKEPIGTPRRWYSYKGEAVWEGGGRGSGLAERVVTFTTPARDPGEALGAGREAAGLFNGAPPTRIRILEAFLLMPEIAAGYELLAPLPAEAPAPHENEERPT